MSKFKNYIPVVVMLVAILLTLSIGTAVAQYTSVFGSTNVETQNVYVGSGETDVGGQTFGRIDASTRGRFGGYTSINIEEELRFGDNDKTTDGFSIGYKVFDLSATTTATELNNTGETIYAYDGYVRVQTATTTAIAYRVGTTTASVFGNDEQCGYAGTCAAATAGDASILDTDTAAATTVGNTYFKVDFAGTDTGYLGDDVVPVADGEYISAYASTSPAANLQAGGQAAQIVIKYYTLDD